MLFGIGLFSLTPRRNPASVRMQVRPVPFPIRPGPIPLALRLVLRALLRLCIWRGALRVALRAPQLA